jgi:hypothetical protein
MINDLKTENGFIAPGGSKPDQFMSDWCALWYLAGLPCICGEIVLKALPTF